MRPAESTVPELPEVETIARGLRPHLTGACIAGVEVPGPHALPQGVQTFCSRLVGRRIAEVTRRGKALLLHFAGEPLTLAVHLRMTGRLFLPDNGELSHDKHTHCRFLLHRDDGSPERMLVYHDVRKFGTLQALLPAELAAWPFFARLGPEPLELGADAFSSLFKDRKGRIKALLLDQTVIAGIGNIYADETLFRAAIRPDAPAEILGVERLTLLHARLLEVLQEAIAACGSSINDYRDAQGHAGAFQNCFKVYGRKGLPCVQCGAPLQTMKAAGRTTVYCNVCQKR
jgi:formamidopyrimidine-DNA glycosylase